VLARLIYGFRISVLFGLALTVAQLGHRHRRRRGAGLLRRLVDLLFQRFIEIWSSLPTLYLLIILASFIQPGFWVLLGIMLLFSWMALVGVVRAEFLRAPQLRLCARGPRAGYDAMRASCTGTSCPTRWSAT
jgi:microcin C transport system permease protein